jgi:hypothetical protein
MLPHIWCRAANSKLSRAGGRVAGVAGMVSAIAAGWSRLPIEHRPIEHRRYDGSP